jgi:predicted amidohydrolase
MKTLVRCSISIACALPLAAACVQEHQEAHHARPDSLLIQNAIVVDGTGSPRFAADLRVRGQHIAAVGEFVPLPGEAVFDAHGMILAPGFIDSHSHADGDILLHPDALAAGTSSMKINGMSAGAGRFYDTPEILTIFLTVAFRHRVTEPRTDG